MPDIETGNAAYTTAAYEDEREFYTRSGIALDLSTMDLRMRFWATQDDVDSIPIVTLTSPSAGLVAVSNILTITLTATQMALFSTALGSSSVVLCYWRLDDITAPSNPSVLEDGQFRILK